LERLASRWRIGCPPTGAIADTSPPFAQVLEAGVFRAGGTRSTTSEKCAIKASVTASGTLVARVGGFIGFVGFDGAAAKYKI